MYKFSQKQNNIIYLDEKLDGFSNIASGLLIQAIGDGNRVAYVNHLNKAVKFTNFIENISLSHLFVQMLKRSQIDLYNFKDKDKISKTLIPLVEFCMITDKIFYNSLNSYNLIIIDNYNSDFINKIKIASIIENNPKAQLIVITSNKKEFNNINEYFNIKVHCKYTIFRKITTNNSITNITGVGVGKSLYSLGYILKEFLYKKDVKLIYFDKGDNIYGDAVFFKVFKRWTIENNLYGNFDFVKTGIKRYGINGYREQNTMLDRKEAKDTLMLLNSALKMQSPIVADELNTIIAKKILPIEEVLPVLNNVKNELIITGEKSHKDILNLSKKLIEFVNLE